MSNSVIQRWVGGSVVNSGAFRTPVAPLYPDSLLLRTPAPDERNGQSDLNGDITGDFTGAVDAVSGLTRFVSATAFKPELLRVNGVGYRFIAIDPELLGIDGSRLPPNGRVPVLWPGGRFLLHSTLRQTLPSPLSAGQQITLTRNKLAYCRLYDQNGLRVATDKFTASLADGIVTMASPLSLSGYSQPLIAEQRIQDLCQITDVNLNGDVLFTPPLAHSYDAADSFVSTVIALGRRQAVIYPSYAGQTWTGNWSDELIGNPATAQYDTISYPFEIYNRDAVGDRFVCLFRTSQTFEFIGQSRGVLATGNINEDFTPINKLTGYRYLRIRKEGWGAGWSAGNYLFLKINPASRGLWAIRTILPHRNALAQDAIKIEFWGNASV